MEANLQAFVCIVPVRMTEAWLLFDGTAIRKAADNPNGRVALKLPPVRRVEDLPDPKQMLHEALEIASEKTGRRLEQFRRDLPRRVQRVAEFIADFEPLRAVPAFHEFEEEVRRTLRYS